MPIEDRQLYITPITEEMKDAYMDYAMSVLVSRALPDVRDGLKPVHRRILYTMREENITPDRAFKKSASTVGNVIARYHPHGDSAVYDAMVRMAQDFSMRYTLVQGHGNFGSVDGDSAAAMRYTEARLERIAMNMLDDLDKDTVDWRPNFDSSLQEPKVLPAKLPNLLLNGADGIAVGMATRIPPHNLGELLSGVKAMMADPDITVEGLMEHIPGPDFPTGGYILGRDNVYQAYSTGNGSIPMRAKMEVESRGGDKKSLVVREIPYQVNKSRLIERIADAIKNGKVEGITALRDESDRNGMRIVMEISSNAQPELVQNQLYRYTELQTNYSCNFVALVNDAPKVLDLKTILGEFISHRRDVVTRRSQFLLDKAQRRAHIVEGLLKALDHIDEIIRLIRASKDGNEARAALMKRFEFSETQAQAILDMRLQRLTGLEYEKLMDEYKELMATIEYLEGLLSDALKLDGLIQEEFDELLERFGDKRKTEFLSGHLTSLNIEDLIKEQKMVVTISKSGYAKRTPVDDFKAQKRGGIGVTAAKLKEDDVLEHMFVASTHRWVMFITNKAKAYARKVLELPEFSRNAKGIPLINLLECERDERVQAIIHFDGFDEDCYVTTCTRDGIVKRSHLSLYTSTPHKGGVLGLRLREGDELVSARLTKGDDELVMISKNGKATRFTEDKVKCTGRCSQGVIGMKLRGDDKIVGMENINPGETLLILSENGYGKRVVLDDIPQYNRGAMGVNIVTPNNDKTGDLIGARMVEEDDDIVVSSVSGSLMRTSVANIKLLSRVSIGVIVFRAKGDDKVASFARVVAEDGLEEDEEEFGFEGRLRWSSENSKMTPEDQGEDEDLDQDLDEVQE